MATKRKNGTLQESVYITNPLTGKRKRVFYYGKDKKELIARRNELFNELAQQFTRNVSLFHEFVEDFLQMKEKEDKLEATTIQIYRVSLNKHILPYIPKDMEVSEVSIPLCKNILTQISGSRTRVAIYVLLSAIFKEAKFRQLIVENPMDYIHRPKHKPKTAEVFSPEDYNTLMTAVRGQEWFYLFSFAWSTGLRRGEICALNWSDIDFGNGMLKVTKAVKRLLKEGEYINAPKTENSIRQIILTDGTIALLKEWRNILIANLEKIGEPFDKNGRIWRNPNKITEPLRLLAISKKFGSLRKNLGLSKDLSFHSLRHTHATLLAQADLSPKKIQARLGHSTAAFTLDRYVHNTPAMQSGVKNAFEKATLSYQITPQKK